MGGITIVIQNAPYSGDNKAWDGLRLAGAALTEDLAVRVHLLDDGVELARRGRRVPEGLVDLEPLLTELIDCGLEVGACGMALDGHAISEAELVSGIRRGSMKSLMGWLRDSDQVVAL